MGAHTGCQQYNATKLVLNQMPFLTSPVKLQK